MAYDRTLMIKQSLDAIKDNNIVFIHEIFAFTAFCQATFYNKKLEQLEEIKKAIEDNRTRQKSKMRSLWYESKQPSLQIAAYKLMATETEYAILNTQSIDHKGQVNIHYDKQDSGV